MLKTPGPTRPHLLFAHAKLSYGGGERVLIEQIAALAELPIRISIAFRFDPEHRDIEAELRARNPNIEEIVYLPTKWSCLMWLLRHRPDGIVACGHSRMNRVLRQLSALGWRIPLMVTLHEHYFGHLNGYRKVKRVARRWIITYDFSAAVKQHLGEQAYHIIHPLYPRPELPRCTPEERHQARQALGLPLDAIVVGYIGRQDINKEPWHVIALAEQLQKHTSQPIWVLLAGRELQDVPKIMDATISQSPLKGRILRLGKLPDLQPAYAALDLYVMTSYQEGYFPLSLIEAMELGVPVAATTVGGIATVLKESVDGFLIHKTDDQKSLNLEALNDAASRIGPMLANPISWEALRERTKARVHKLVAGYDARTPFQEAVKGLLNIG